VLILYVNYIEMVTGRTTDADELVAVSQHSDIDSTHSSDRMATKYFQLLKYYSDIK